MTLLPLLLSKLSAITNLDLTFLENCPVSKRQHGVLELFSRTHGIKGLNCVPNVYVEVLTPITSEGDLIWRQDL